LLRDLLPAIGVHDQRDAHEDEREERQEPDQSLPRQAPQPQPPTVRRGLPLSRRGRRRRFTSGRRFDLVQARFPFTDGRFLGSVSYKIFCIHVSALLWKCACEEGEMSRNSSR
jgi:hypothetical protein